MITIPVKNYVIQRNPQLNIFKRPVFRITLLDLEIPALLKMFNQDQNIEIIIIKNNIHQTMIKITRELSWLTSNCDKILYTTFDANFSQIEILITI